MAVKDKLEQRKCIETVWGKLITEKDGYNFGVRHIAGFSSNIFQVMRILEPDFFVKTFMSAKPMTARKMRRMK